MRQLRIFIRDDWARIPFSIIGVFLIIGSTITTAYIYHLEQEKAKEISFTLETNTIEPIVQIAEADLARALNYAACEALQELGNNPVRDGYQTTQYYKQGLSVSQVNLNIVRDMTRHRFNTYVQKNFQNKRFYLNEYSVECNRLIEKWEDISVRIIDMTLERTLCHPLRSQDQQKSYPVYFVLTLDLDVTVTNTKKNTVVFEKTSKISTLITSRYLLLERLTDEFANNLVGSTGSLGISVLSSAMLLTWIRGFAQYTINKPQNIVGNDWLAVITNTGILFEQEFTFNAADPLGIVYLGYETAKAVARDFKLTTFINPSPDVENAELKKQTENPVGTNGEANYRQAYATFNPNPPVTLPESTSFNTQVNIKDICNKTRNNIISDIDNTQLILFSKFSAYNPTLHTKVHRDPPSEDNKQSLIQSRDIAAHNVVQTTLRQRAEQAAQNYVDSNPSLFPPSCGSWTITVSLVSSVFPYVESYTSEWGLYRTPELKYLISLENSNPNMVLLDGACYEVYRERGISWSCTISTTWTARAVPTNTSCGPQSIPSFTLTEPFFYQSPQTWQQKQQVRYLFRSDSYSGDVLFPKKIAHPFEPVSFMGLTDPNMAVVYPRDDETSQSVVSYYKNLIGWTEAIIPGSLKYSVLANEEGENLYRRDITPCDPKQCEYRLYPSWLELAIQDKLREWEKTIADTVSIQVTINENSFADELEKTTTQNLLGKFNDNYQSWLNTLLAQCTTNEQGPFQGFFISAGAKAVYNVVKSYINQIKNKLENYAGEAQNENKIEEATNTAEEEYEDEKPGDQFDESAAHYDKIKQNTQNAHTVKTYLQNSMQSFPLGLSMRLTHQSETGDPVDSWSEQVSFAIQQRPAFLSTKNYEKYYTAHPPQPDETPVARLKYRNLNVFSPAAGTENLIREGFDALNQQILTGIDAGFEKLGELSGETRQIVEQSLKSLTDRIYSELYSKLAQNINNAKGSGSFLNQYQSLISPTVITNKVKTILSTYKNQGQSVFIDKLSQEIVKNDIIRELQNHIQGVSGYSQHIKDAAKETIKNQVLSAYDKTISAALQSMRNILKTEYEKISAQIETKVSEAVATSLCSVIPAGLPVLPPFGWWCTLNIWYIEIEGDIIDFCVSDVENEANTHPLWGHTSQEYRRTKKNVHIDLDGDSTPDTLVGQNTFIHFEVKTGTFIIVPPGKTGVGDRSGGWEENDEYPK